MQRLRLLLLIFITFVFCISNCTSVYAKGGIEVQQTRIVFEAEKHQGLSVPIVVTNSSAEEMSVKIAKADFIIANDGAFQIKDAGTTPGSASNLISCQESEFLMKPGGEISFDVSLNPDKNISFQSIHLQY